PFIGAFRQQIFDVVSQYNSENGTDIFVVDTEGWIPPEPLHPNREGHLTAGRKLAEILKRRYNI
ncbi:MAG: hypothetical protein J6T73_02955, partial [Clostridia bacterium]|nr:hypothetical protein [Clostridia bacterium]